MKHVAIVTGAARGVGLAVAKRLGSAGHTVYMLDVLEADLREAAGKLAYDGISAIPLAIDLASQEHIADLPKRIGQPFEDVSVLVNNAGIAPIASDGRPIPGPEIGLEQWERVLTINLTAPFRMMQLCIPSMKRRGWGRIINISSRAGRSPGGSSGADYVASKSGLLGLTRAFAHDVAASGITVNSIAPGRIDTPMGMSSSEELLKMVRSKIPVARLGQPEEVAALVAYLAGEESGFITGAVIDINGGALMI
jgi:3-oxoacyl-[acyl-carrier protein] reductase